MLRDCHVAIPFAVVHNFSYLPYNNKKDIRIYFMAPYCSNRNTNCYCQNGNYRPQTRQENERQLHCNIPVPPLPEQKSKNYCCDECVDDYSKTDVLQEFPVAMAYVPWQQWRKLHDLGYGFQCGTIFQELEKPFRGKGGCCK